MAKSIRSKAKRSFRAKKRTEGIYAATEAGRLHRLNSKIRAHISSQLPESLEENSRDAEEDLIEEAQTGPYWFEILGLFGDDQIDADTMHGLDTLVRLCERQYGMKRVVNLDINEGHPDFYMGIPSSFISQT
jgi:hypothetical protein